MMKIQQNNALTVEGKAKFFKDIKLRQEWSNNSRFSVPTAKEMGQ